MAIRLGAEDKFPLLSSLYSVLLELKVTHFNTKSFAAHEALGKIYDSLDGLLDDLAEKWSGYKGEVPTELRIGTISASDPKSLGQKLKDLGDRVNALGRDSSFGDIENIGQEISGLGAKLLYLSRLT